MTNREKINNMSNQEIAEILCNAHDFGCSSCPAYNLCEFNGITANGFIKWLESEAEEES